MRDFLWNSREKLLILGSKDQQCTVLPNERYEPGNHTVDRGVYLFKMPSGIVEHGGKGC